jgi:excisionase family DNA binding protein
MCLMEDTDLMTMKQAADLLGVSKATVWRRYKAGRLPAANAAELNAARDKQVRILFHRADVERLKPPR